MVSNGTNGMNGTGVTPPRSAGGVLGALLGLVATSAVAGLLVTVSLTPVLALTGVTASTTIGTFANLPDYLAIEPLAQRSNIYATRSDGTPVLLATLYDQNRVEVGWDDIGQNVKDAAIAGEDPRFYEHGGVDVKGTVRGALTTALRGTVQGGSSITQQYVKNVLVQRCETLPTDAEIADCYDEATQTTVVRKLKEMRLAIGVEKKYAKNDILRQYLNIAGFGGRVYGIEAAADYYYNSTAANLTAAQAASLTAIVNNPDKFRLDRPESETNGAANGYRDNKQRRDYILGEMLRFQKITQAEHDEAVATPIEPVINEPSTGCQTALADAFFCDYVTQVLASDPVFGPDEATRLKNFRSGGYDVYTTLDLDLQRAAVLTLNDNVPKSRPGWDVGGVISSVEVGTGRVLAMAQNKDYSQDPEVQATGNNWTSVNYNTDFADGGSRGFQPGSTYKVFTLAEWLNTGHRLEERVDSAPKSRWGTFNDSCLGPQNYDSEGWSPKNDANESGGRYSALESTIRSINTGYIGMAKRLDLCGIRKMAESFGMHRADGEPLSQSAAAVIGTNEVAPLSIAVAFAGIANRGVTCSPVVIDRMVDASGEEVPIPSTRCTESVRPETAAQMVSALSRVMTGGTATQSYTDTAPRVPVIGKTGTTDGAKDTWMSGASSEVATVVGVVSVTGNGNQRAMRFPSGPVATARHRMWPDVMSVANEKYGGEMLEGIPVERPEGGDDDNGNGNGNGNDAGNDNDETDEDED
ncbi:penicillin-binding protein [Cryobacterium sp. 1639]|uniref:transglycosylase domain-containing protein n=1 Tax=Cryobacterium inferilacus TaxID=2866629 RepID=UPI001C73CE5E|nr:transglycosylase domain-containing protein [Cryobacterium sp. 1639]MBX0298733.1 penicillin-binding protein [Cryobacterium sp. 1639]